MNSKTNTLSSTGQPFPTLADIKNTRTRIAKYISVTPMWAWNKECPSSIFAQLFPETEVFIKLELLQKTGTFKPRGALNVMMNFTPQELSQGVVAMSGGNHAIAVAYAAQTLGASAKVVMPATASPIRQKLCQDFGAEVILSADMHTSFALVDKIAKDEKRMLVHPFDGPFTVQGTGTIGLEICEQTPGLDAIIIPIGGGGLCGGIAAAIKQINPKCQVFGVEPEGADIMYRSFQAGRPEKIDKVMSIADSLGAPYALPYSYELCRLYVNEVVRVSEEQIKDAMRALFMEMKLAVEPAGAVSTAALMGPLHERLKGKRVALIACGTNIDIAKFSQLLLP